MMEKETVIGFTPPLTAKLKGKPVKIVGYIPDYPPRFKWENKKSSGITTSDHLDIDLKQEFPTKAEIELGREIPPHIKRIITERLDEVENEIKQEMQKIQRSFRQEMNSGTQTLINHPAEAALDASPAAAQTQIIKNCEKRLAKIRTARLRLTLGIYGLCGSCGEEISLERLEKIPFAHNCVKCKEKEQATGSFPNRRHNKAVNQRR